MKKKRLAIRWLAACLAALLGLLGFLLLQPDRAGDRREEAPVYEITRMPLAQLAAVSVKNSKAAFAVMQTAEGLEMVSANGGAYDAAQLRALLYAACNLTGSRRITDRSAFERYGLSAPRAGVTLYLSDGGTRSFSILAENPLDGGSYLHWQEEDAVYLVPGLVAELFLRSEADFLSRSVFPLKTRADYARIGEVAFAYHGQGRDYVLRQTEGGWFLVSPVRHRLSGAYLSSSLLDQLLALYAQEVLAAGAEPRDFGFDAPRMTVTLSMDGREYRALFVQDGEKGFLMTDPDNGTVYRVARDPVLLLLQDYTALLGGTVLNYSAGDIAGIRAAAPDTAGAPDAGLWLEFSGEGETLAVTRDGSPLERQERTALLSALNQLPAAGEMARQPADGPALSLTLSLRAGSADRIDFIPLDEEYAAVSVNGEANFFTTAAAVRRLQEALFR